MEDSVSRRISDFGKKLFKEADSSERTVCSPVSVMMALAMLTLGCKDGSKEELLRALGVPDIDAVLSSFAHIKSALKSIRGGKLTIANKLYIKRRAEMYPNIKKDLEEIFEATIQQVDFANALATYAINDWIGHVTRGNNSLDTVLKNTTSLVLVNAIYFLGAWEKPFDATLNTCSVFYTQDTTSLVISMTIRKTLFKYGVSEELKARLLQLNFEGGEASMVIVLPDELDGLTAMLGKLESGHDIMADIKNLRDTELDVSIPKFETLKKSQINLVSCLVKLGITSIFNEERSEVNMLTSEDIVCGSNAGQSTSFEINEIEKSINGFSSSSMLSRKDIKTDPGVDIFVANRPFLYIIIVRGLPIFLGSYKGSQGEVVEYSRSQIYQNIFTLSATTFYSRYNNSHEQERLNQILEEHNREVSWSADMDNYINMNIDKSGLPVNFFNNW